MRAVGALAIVGVGALVGGWLSVLASVAATRRGVSPEASRAIETGVPAVVIAVGAVSGLEHLFGLPMISVSLTFGVIVLSLGLGGVPLLANLAVGVAFRWWERPRIGSRLGVGSVEGPVRAVDSLGVQLRGSGDGETFVPWLWLLVHPVRIRPDKVADTVTVPLVLAGQTNIEHATAALLAAAPVDGVLDEPAPQVVVLGLVARGVSVELRASVEAQRSDEVRSALITAILAELRDADVEIAA